MIGWAGMKRLRLLIAQLALLSCLGLFVALQLATGTGDQRATLVDAGAALLPRLSFSFRDIGAALAGSEDDVRRRLSIGFEIEQLGLVADSENTILRSLSLLNLTTRFQGLVIADLYLLTSRPGPI